MSRPPQWFSENRLACVLVIAAVACLFVDAGLAWWVRSGRTELGKQQKRLVAMQEKENEYRRIVGNRQASEAPARPGTLSLTALNLVAQEKEINRNITSSHTNPRLVNPQLREQVIELAITGVSRHMLSDFLWAVEKIDPAIRTRELRISDNTGQPNLIDAKVTVSAYESVANKTK